MTPRESELIDALNRMTDAYEQSCEQADDWCGNTTCYRCGRDATLIATSRAIIKSAESGMITT